MQKKFYNLEAKLFQLNHMCSSYNNVLMFSVIEGGIAQAVPEHPKRDNIFSLSTAFGDAYLFQVSLLFILNLQPVSYKFCRLLSHLHMLYCKRYGSRLEQSDQGSYCLLLWKKSSLKCT